MAANYFDGGTTGKTVNFDRFVNYLTVFVASGVTFTMSLDSKGNHITIPAGLHSFVVGAIKTIEVTSTGAWQINGVQS